MYNSGTISLNEYIWNDKRFEERRENANTTNADIREVRIFADTTNVYFLVKLGDVTADQHPLHQHRAGHPPLRRRAARMNWIGDDAGTYYGGGYFGSSQAAVHYAQRNIIVHKAGGAAQVEMYADDGGDWYPPPGGVGARRSARRTTRWSSGSRGRTSC